MRDDQDLKKNLDELDDPGAHKSTEAIRNSQIVKCQDMLGMVRCLDMLDTME